MHSGRAKLIDLQQIVHPSGTITVLEQGIHLPFDIRRVYFLHGLSKDSVRGAHAHRNLSQLMIAVSGRFRVRLSGSGWSEDYDLVDPNTALFIPPMTWRELDDFSVGAVCLVMASAPYDEDDYIRDHLEFLRLIGSSSG